METGFEKAWERFISGRAPAHIVIHERFAEDDIKHERYPVGAWASFDEIKIDGGNDANNSSGPFAKKNNKGKKSRGSEKATKRKASARVLDAEMEEENHETESISSLLNGKDSRPRRRKMTGSEEVSEKRARNGKKNRKNKKFISNDQTSDKDRHVSGTKRSRATRQSRNLADTEL